MNSVNHSESGAKPGTAHDANPETHLTLIKLVEDYYQSSDYKLIVADSKRDFYGKALLQTGVGEGRKAYFKLDGKQRIPTIIVLNGQQLAKWEIAMGRRYRVYVPGGQQVATLREEG
ncbi:MAG: hypothetical protein V4568_17525 [Pseudomonadota bacterium]